MRITQSVASGVGLAYNKPYQPKFPISGLQGTVQLRFSGNIVSMPSTNPPSPEKPPATLPSGKLQPIVSPSANPAGPGTSNPLLHVHLSLADFNTQIQNRHALAGQDHKLQWELMSDLAEVLDEFLQDRWTETSQPGKLTATVDALKDLLGPRGQGNTVLAQINPTPGDLPGNAKKIMRYMRLAEALGVDTVVFPELALMGYPIYDVITRHPQIVDEQLRWLEALAAQSSKTRVLLGFVESRKVAEHEQRFGKPYFNSMAILGEGKIQGLVRKSLLPTYGEFNDDRTFEPSPTAGVLPADLLGDGRSAASHPTVNGAYPIAGHTYGLSICEDTWNDKTFISHPLYHRDPIRELSTQKPEVLINISSSPSRFLKEQVKHNMLSHIARETGIPYVYVNQSGAIDELSFDGASRAYDGSGQLIARAKSFAEQFLIINPITAQGRIYPLPDGLENTLTAVRIYDPTHQEDLARTYQSVVQGIRDYFAKTGFQRAVLGLSGGLDSAVTATLLADALGPQNVAGISMPSQLTPEENKSDAKTLANNLGIRFKEKSIVPQIEAAEEFAQDMEQEGLQWFGAPGENPAAKENTQATIRAQNLRRFANRFNALPIATSDKSELYVGYATVNGDMSGALAPIGDIPKTKVRALARWRNMHGNLNGENKNPIPVNSIEKPSGADLRLNPITGKLVTAEEDLMPYEFLDELIWRVEFLADSYEELMRHRFFYEDARQKRGEPELSPEQKKEWIDKFYRKMNAAVFKWHLMPPILITDGYGITGIEYRQPIVTRLNPQPHTVEEITQMLEGDNANFPITDTSDKKPIASA